MIEVVKIKKRFMWQSNVELPEEVELQYDCQKSIMYVPKDKAPGDTSDGYHTFDELYEHRTGILAALCNVMTGIILDEGMDAEDASQMVFKSWHHFDGDMYDGMFIVGINCSMKPGPWAKWATWHCEAKWWDKFLIPEIEYAPEWDGHTPKDALERLVRAYCTE